MEKMKAASLMPKKFRSVREKNGSHRRSKSSEPGGKARPLTAESWLSIFKPESVKQAQREKEEEEKEAAKVEEIQKRLEELNCNSISEELIRYAINSKFAGGDTDKALELLQLQQKAFAGIVQPYNPNVQMLGAENRGNVTCYLDALLFAMFAKLSAFECMLKNDSTDEPKTKLAALIRLWVNMLRSGKLVHTDMTQHIQESLAACGWEEARLLEQQDTSEAFAFITETLQLPLLTLQVDLFHHGKRDADDHKVVHERLLNLAVPPDPDGKGLKLEDCLEEYFNNQVDVLRDSPEEKKGAEKSGKSTIKVVAEEDEGTPSAQPAEIQQVGYTWTTENLVTESPVSTMIPSIPRAFDSPPTLRHRSTSIIQRIVVPDGEQVPPGETTSLLQRAKRTGSTVVKAVTIPAWQFFKLIPWHAASNGEPSNDIEVARHFNQRPVVGICLKRYTMTDKGVPKRQNTLIDIPDSLRLPHFMAAGDVKATGEVEADQESNGLSQEYKLVLQSVVCHRGDSLQSGHYIAFARVAPKLLTDNRRHDSDPPPDYEEAQWAKFDDLAVENRVSYVDDIKESLREEMPYLLFYQIVPMVDVTTASTDGSVVEPPSYNESAVNLIPVPGTPIVDIVPDMVPDVIPDQPDGISGLSAGFFDSATTLVHSGGPSIRFSSDLERPSRLSFDDDPYSIHTRANSSRRASVAFSESAAGSPAATPEVPSPAITPQEESTATRLSRAAAKFTKAGAKSRPSSQIGDGRISTTISKLGFSRPSKDTLNSGTSGNETSDDQAVIAEEEELANKEKEHSHHHKKDRAKSKSREKDDRKEKDKFKDSGKAVKEEGVPDRECAVM
ncbi:ubiquitin carboxyl-terminal hydrolase-domain-containing protein [Lasiosphaeria miniovina]|uniref:ubiquitinyl hydrolase 1 n=1 Tax=Lasiosphaeria miniovina TaxID=1954250 RepID=A0AA40B5U3_9PEZI|nr:ubiquitin carboxyl-terminal hydrolase-domain-containing protein [Lasiosphaeria miniovina]KAK0727913.1 ubiquitin carboxyl-terminal hydrolase-domain-containing protein [Lasiosphaeria miniovina]